MKPFRYVNVWVFIGMLCLLAVANAVAPAPAELLKTENRMATQKPVLTAAHVFDGTYFSTYENYFADHFILRDKWLGVSRTVSSLAGSSGDSAPQVMTFEGANVAVKWTAEAETADTDETDDLKAALQSTENAGAQSEEMEAIEGDARQFDNWGKLLVYGDSVMEINTSNPEANAHYAAAINTYWARFKDTCNVYSLLIPTRIEFLKDDDYREMSASQRDTIDDMRTKLDQGVQFIDVYDTLAAHASEYIYFRTDHHWTQLGAKYAFEVLAEAINGEVPQQLDRLEPIEVHGYLGSLYTATSLENLTNHPDTVTYYKGLPDHEMRDDKGKVIENGRVYALRWLDTPQKYGVFLGGDRAYTQIETHAGTGRRFLVLKDSYANAFTPFLTMIADEIIVIDPRLYTDDVDQLISEHQITDIIFVNYALVNRWDGYAGLYEELLAPNVP
ncbi:hypothetical protein KHM83_04390 [Fusibacter paucivorans]|uniref:AlgX/AlgJ SGNH hydrolase-like domain-containing protein n=1 Tax=Fusibacter paucivorans TaxID=76009 RepID=A0ABS5PL70_9FIRM|nr:DHHW family protein [Fusibacter paucivorans]MBS7525915.1 hypothetical protein [Fusibacter paucivorans]